MRIWLEAFRPKTLSAALAPVLMGAALSMAHFDWPTFVWTLCCATLIQIGTNLANDYFDFRKGADTEERIGPTRITQAGLVKPEAVRRAFVICFVLALCIGAGLLLRGGWPIFVIGSLSLIFGIMYTGGPWPLAYLGLGDIFAFVFFGPVAVAGTNYLITLQWSTAAWIAGIGPGLLSAALLVVNNLRDCEGDRRAAKRTTVVRFGQTFARFQYVSCLLGAALVPVWLVVFEDFSLLLLLSTLSLLSAIPALKLVLKEQGAVLNDALAITGRTLFLYGLFFCAGLVF